jgi:hypothetical protein
MPVPPRSARLEAVERRALGVLPALAVAVVGFGLLVVGKPRPVVGVRLRGGPTEARTVSFRVEVVEHSALGERRLGRLPVDAELTRGTSVIGTFRGVLDDEGAASLEGTSREGPPGPVHVRIAVGRERTIVADARVSLSRAAWLAPSRRRGGWVEGRATVGGLRLRTAAARGVFAVPFRDDLRVEVRRRDAPVVGVVVRATADGADLGRAQAITDGAGIATFPVTPREHAVSVAVSAGEGDDRAVLETALAVVPGALHAELDGDDLVVRAPVPHDRAYVALVDGEARLRGATVRLEPDGRGGARGAWHTGALAAGPLWAVVSSEPDLESPSVVGWPLRAEGSAPPTTFDVPDALVLDTVPDAFRDETERVRTARVVAAAFAVVALALSAVLLVLRTRRAARALERGLAEAGSDRAATERVAGERGGILESIAVAVLCLALAALLVALFATWR